MRIAYLSSIYPTSSCPGRGAYNGQLCRALAIDHDVQVIAPLSWRDPRPGTDAHPIPDVPTETPRFYYPPGVLRPRLHQFMWHSIRSSVLNQLRRFRPDLVLSYWAHPDGAVAQLAARSLQIPCVNIVGGSDVLLEADQSRRGTRIREVFQSSDHLVAVSPNIAVRLTSLGIPQERISIIPRGIDHTIFHEGRRTEDRKQLGISAAALTVFGCGRLVPVKDWGLFLDTCAILAERDSELQVGIAGDGPLMSDLQSRVRRNGLESHVRLLGNADPSELATWYRAADCSLLTSHSEGVPNVLLESIACGTPFVATDVGGIRTIYDDRRDRLVESRCPIQLADAVAQVQQNAPIAERRYQPPSWLESAQRMTEIFNALTGTLSAATP